MKKRGTILIENIIFIILNLIFLSILVIFLVKQGQGTIVLEETYSKQIAMIADSAKPVMMIKLDMEKGKKLAERNGIDFGEAVKINGNVVTVKLSSESGYSYVFFNDVDIVPYAETDKVTREFTGMYIFSVDYNGEENE